MRTFIFPCVVSRVLRLALLLSVFRCGEVPHFVGAVPSPSRLVRSLLPRVFGGGSQRARQDEDDEPPLDIESGMEQRGAVGVASGSGDHVDVETIRVHPTDVPLVFTAEDLALYECLKQMGYDGGPTLRSGATRGGRQCALCLEEDWLHPQRPSTTGSNHDVDNENEDRDGNHAADEQIQKLQEKTKQRKGPFDGPAAAMMCGHVLCGGCAAEMHREKNLACPVCREGESDERLPTSAFPFDMQRLQVRPRPAADQRDNFCAQMLFGSSCEYTASVASQTEEKQIQTETPSVRNMKTKGRRRVESLAPGPEGEDVNQDHVHLPGDDVDDIRLLVKAIENGDEIEHYVQHTPGGDVRFLKADGGGAAAEEVANEDEPALANAIPESEEEDEMEVVQFWPVWRGCHPSVEEADGRLHAPFLRRAGGRGRAVDDASRRALWAEQRSAKTGCREPSELDRAIRAERAAWEQHVLRVFPNGALGAFLEQVGGRGDIKDDGRRPRSKTSTNNASYFRQRAMLDMVRTLGPRRATEASLRALVLRAALPRLSASRKNTAASLQRALTFASEMALAFRRATIGTLLPVFLDMVVCYVVYLSLLDQISKTDTAEPGGEEMRGHALVDRVITSLVSLVPEGWMQYLLKVFLAVAAMNAVPRSLPVFRDAYLSGFLEDGTEVPRIDHVESEWMLRERQFFLTRMRASSPWREQGLSLLDWSFLTRCAPYTRAYLLARWHVRELLLSVAGGGRLLGEGANAAIFSLDLLDQERAWRADSVAQNGDRKHQPEDDDDDDPRSAALRRHPLATTVFRPRCSTPSQDQGEEEDQSEVNVGLARSMQYFGAQLQAVLEAHEDDIDMDTGVVGKVGNIDLLRKPLQVLTAALYRCVGPEDALHGDLERLRDRASLREMMHLLSDLRLALRFHKESDPPHRGANVRRRGGGSSSPIGSRSSSSSSCTYTSSKGFKPTRRATEAAAQSSTSSEARDYARRHEATPANRGENDEASPSHPEPHRGPLLTEESKKKA